VPRTQRQLNGFLISNSDTSGNNKFVDVSLLINVEQDVGEYIVPASVKKATWGGGKMFAVLFDDTTTAVREEGIWRFYVSGGSGTRYKVFEARSEVVGAAGQISVPSEHNFMPEGGLYAPAGGKLIVTYQSDATDILDTTDCTITSLPIVEYS